MASEKNERLINLTIALLAAKKYLTKAQIFKSVSGYEGNNEATDRMFERDKEELRSLGIQIEMQSIDPLFEDEVGYRIFPDRYKFNLGPLTPAEVTLLALAAEAWKESALSDVAHSTAIRLESLGISADFSELISAPTVSNVPANISELLEAIQSTKEIEFSYLGQENRTEAKRVQPLGIYSINQKWYLYAVDILSDQKRSYRLDRITNEVKRTQKSFVKPEFALPIQHFPKVDTILSIRRDFAKELSSKGELIPTEISNQGDWLTYRVSFISDNDAIAQILRFSPNVKIIEPIYLVSEVTKTIGNLAGMYAN